MKLLLKLILSTALVCSVTSQALAATPILQAGDAILAIDAGPLTSHSRHPGGEDAPKAVDSNPATKYLNFGDQGSRANARNSGFIVTPTNPGTIVQSMVITTANDAENRDPTRWAIYGTNDPITSANNSDGQAENWTLISEGDVALPATRQTLGPVLPFANATPYNSYRIVFPELKNFRDDGLMQVADVGLFSSLDATGSNILAAGNPTIAIQLPRSGAQSPMGEGPEKMLDGLSNTKYLNFGKENSGFIVSPASGSSVVGSFRITTANDSPSRDPSSWILYGTNDVIVSPNFSQGNLENWVEIDAGAIELPLDRETAGPIVSVSNATSYSSYKMVFPTMRDSAAGDADSMQFAEIQMFAIPEPATLGLAVIGFSVAAIRRRRP
jgi:hypothetical protein